MCTRCKCFFAKSYKTKHQLKCGKYSSQAIIPSISIGQAILASVSIGSLDKVDPSDKDFLANILNSIINDEVGILAKTALS